MISDELQRLIRDDFINEIVSHKFLKIKNLEQWINNKFLTKRKLCDNVEPLFFIVNGVHGQSKNV